MSLYKSNKNAINVFISNRKNICQGRRNGFCPPVALHLNILNTDGKNSTGRKKNALENSWYKFEGINPPYKLLM